jgi:hypothetical protein
MLTTRVSTFLVLTELRTIKMGVSESKCVNLDGAATYLEEAYTVRRTSGDLQDGWKLAKEGHRCYNQDPRGWKARAHANLGAEGWRVHLHNGEQKEEDPEAHSCGWRRQGTFWPTRLTGDQAAIDAWTEGLRDHLEELAGRQGLPDLWEKHTCNIGAPANFCDGCCGERRAKEKKQLLDALDLLAIERASATDEDKLVEIESREHSAQKKLAAIPTAAQHRAWRAWRNAQDLLKSAKEDQRFSGITDEMIAALQAEADRLRPAAGLAQRELEDALS